MDTTFSIEEAFKNPSIGGNPFNITDLGLFISNVLEVLMILAAIASLLYLFWGGLEWIISGGDKSGTEKAKSKITDAVIGLIVVFSAWAIFQILQTFLGFNITGGTSGKTSGGGCGPQQTAWVQNKKPQCVKPTYTDWECWRKEIIKDPCINFYMAGDTYWWDLHKECSRPAPLACPK